jgi:hypothetical protein
LGALVLVGVGFVAYRHFLGADSAACAVEGARDVTMNKEVDGGPLAAPANVTARLIGPSAQR